MKEVITSLENHIPDLFEIRRRIYVDLIKAFEGDDCDTLEECWGDDEAFNRALVDCGYDDWDEEEA
jgi:hypothetical protein